MQGYDRRSHVYGTLAPRPSVMEETPYITCDDVDGLITLLDRFTKTPRIFESFCRDGLRFINGRQHIDSPQEKQSLDMPLEGRRNARYNITRALRIIRRNGTPKKGPRQGIFD